SRPNDQRRIKRDDRSAPTCGSLGIFNESEVSQWGRRYRNTTLHGCQDVKVHAKQCDPGSQPEGLARRVIDEVTVPMAQSDRVRTIEVVEIVARYWGGRENDHRQAEKESRGAHDPKILSIGQTVEIPDDPCCDSREEARRG